MGSITRCFIWAVFDQMVYPSLAVTITPLDVFQYEPWQGPDARGPSFLATAGLCRRAPVSYFTQMVDLHYYYFGKQGKFPVVL